MRVARICFLTSVVQVRGGLERFSRHTEPYLNPAPLCVRRWGGSPAAAGAARSVPGRLRTGCWHLSGPGSAGSRALLTATFHFLASQLVAISFWSETRLQIQPRARVCFTPERLGDARPAPQPRPRGPAEPFVPAPLGWTPSRSRGRRDPAAPRRQTALGSAPPGASCWRRGRAARGRAGAGPGAAARPPASRAERSGAQGPRGSGRPAAAAADGEERRRRPAAAACPVEAPEKELRMRLPWKAKMVTGSSRGVRGRLCVAASVCAAGRSPAGSVRGCGGSLCGSSPRSSRHVSG